MQKESAEENNAVDETTVAGRDGEIAADPDQETVLVPPVRLHPFQFLSDYPKNRNNGWHSNVQGATHDDDYWYITQQYRLWKFPISHDLNESVDGGEPGVSYVDLDELGLSRYDHFGDLDHYDGKLYVPLEDLSGDATPAVGTFDARDLSFLGAWLLPHQASDKKAPWCAVNPVNGLLYTSSFWMNDQRGYLKMYRRRFDSTFNSFPFVGGLRLQSSCGGPITVNKVQGGVFSPNGNLYLVSDTEQGGILGFDAASGRQILHTPIDYDPGTGEELEGITIWNLDDGRAPHIRGHIHVLMIDEDALSDDDLYFKHFHVRVDDLPKL